MNERDAVQKAVALKPDLVVLDFSMPEMDGLQAADEIRRILPNVKLILHTMYGTEVRREALKYGISKIVEKAAHGALVAAVRELLMATDTEKRLEPSGGPSSELNLNLAYK